MWGPVLPATSRTVFSKPSSPPRLTAWAWASRSAAPSSWRMAGSFWSRPVSRSGRCFRSNSLSTKPARHDIVHERPDPSAAIKERDVNETIEAPSFVYVIDDDAAMREALQSLFASVGLRVETFGSALDFLGKKLPNAAICLVVDIRLQGLGGLDFQAELTKANIDVPIIFITGYGDIAMTVKAMKAGAVEFFSKPFRDQDLLDAVKLGLEKNEAKRNGRKTDAIVNSLFDSLTPREQEVMRLVTTGLRNKQ